MASERAPAGLRRAAAKALILVALTVHGWLTWRAYQKHGYAGFFPPFTHSNTAQIFSDLVLALGLVNLWIFSDLKRRGQSAMWSVVVLAGTTLGGSFAPLLYFLFRAAPPSPKANA